MFEIIIFLVIFVAAHIFLAYIGYKKTKTTADYLVGGKGFSSLVIALSYGATFISAVALVGFTGAASMYGYSLLYLAFLNIFIGIFIAFLFFGIPTRRLGLKLKAKTFPELIGKKFKSKNLQAVSGGIIAIFIVMYCASVFMAVAYSIETILYIPYIFSAIAFTIIVGVYLITGGLYAVTYTQIMQSAVMMIGMLTICTSIYSQFGGIAEAHNYVANLNLAEVKNFTVPNGIFSLTSEPVAFSPAFMLLLTLIFGVGIGCLAQPQLITRYMMAKDEKSLKLAVPYGGVFILLMTFIAFSIGPLCTGFIFKHGFAYPKTPDAVLPFVLSNISPILSLVFLFAILSASMSTASALFHTASTAIGYDIYSNLFGKNKNELMISRIGAFVIVSATLLITLAPPETIPFMCAFFFGLMGGTFLSVYALLLYWKKISRIGAWCGITSGFVSTMLWYIFIYAKTSKFIFGKLFVPNYMINLLDPLFIAIPISLIFTVLGSLIFKD